MPEPHKTISRQNADNLLEMGRSTKRAHEREEECTAIAIEMYMPKRCLDCPINTSDMTCSVTRNQTFDDIMRPRWCPLHEIEKNGCEKETKRTPKSYR